MLRRKSSGQNIVELAICLAVIAAVFSAFSLYIKRAMQARYSEGPDYLISQIQGEKSGNFQDIEGQYEPYYNQSSYTDRRQGVETRGYPDSKTNITTTRSGWSTTGLPGEND